MNEGKLKEVLEKRVKIRLYSKRECPKKACGMNKTTIKRICLVFGQLFSGTIDEVAIFEHALTERDVKDHYYAFVNKGMVHSPGAVKQFEGS